MRFVPVKSAERQAQASVLSVRELLVKQRTQLINALRGQAAEFGIIAAKGAGNAAALAARNGELPIVVKEMLARLGQEIARLNQTIAALDKKLAALHRASPVSRRLCEVPGVGQITALTATLTVDPDQFKSGRHLAAWVGLTPKERSTGGKRRLGAISKQGNERLRQLLVLGAMAVIKVAKPGHRYATPWLLR